MNATRSATVVIGGGQAGLVMGYHLQRAGQEFVIVEAAPRVGDSWRRRYDSLRLFSYPKFASLPGWRIPTRGCPNRDEMADYLEEYASRFDLPVRTGVRVRRVSRHGSAFEVETSAGTYLADQVVVSSGAHARPLIPALAKDLDPAIRQLHSLDYRNPGQLAPGGVLVVGAANSGTDIALDAAAAGHPTWIAGRHPGQVPIDIDKPAAKAAVPIMMFAFRHILTLRTPIGRKLKSQAEGHGLPLIRNKLVDLDQAGVTRVGRITAVQTGRPVTADGTVPDVSTVVWCTGSTTDHSFLDLPAGPSGQPAHYRGVADQPGLYFLGQEFQFAAASATIQGLDRDTRYLLRHMRKSDWGRTSRTGRAVPDQGLTSSAV